MNSVPRDKKNSNPGQSGSAKGFAALDSVDFPDFAPGSVWLVGAGPGAPGLLTLLGYHALTRADVIVYDALVARQILEWRRGDATLVFAGKRGGKPSAKQQDISLRLVELAKENKRVLRLKGGDPFIFGRGGEEIEALAAEGIPFQVVPGITAALGCAAYAGIPLTHRDHAQTCIFVTGHGKDGELDLDWKTLLRPRQTVAIYMGLSSLGQLMRSLMDHGADPTLPAAVIDNGTRDTQRVVSGSLETLDALTVEAGLQGPALIIIGTVATLRDKLKWFKPGAAATDVNSLRERAALPVAE